MREEEEKKEMQCVNSNCVATATPHLPPFGASNSKAKLSQIQFRRNPNGYEEDGDGSEVSLLPLPPHVKSITDSQALQNHL